MPTTYLFTTTELLSLMAKSSAMRSLTVEQISLIQSQIQDPNSEKAQQLYEALIKELREYRRIDKEFIVNTNQVMTGFEGQVKAIKVTALHREREDAETQAKMVEQQAAENIIKNL